MFKRNVTSGRRAPESYTKYALKESDYKRLLEACGTTRDHCLLEIACELGLRRDDVIALEIRNVDFLNKKLTFYEAKKKRIRALPLPTMVMSNIRKHIATLQKGSQFLFPASRSDSKTGHMSGMEAWRVLQEVCKVAGISAPPDRKDRPFHALRGTCYKLRQNRDKWTIEQAAAWLGDTPQTAMSHYGKTSDSELETLIEKQNAC